MSTVAPPGPSTILTASGRYVDPLALAVEDVLIEDIAHALSNQCRFSGHVSRFYSVADHSVRVAELVEARGGDLRTQLWALLHDAAEAYLVDLPRPLKRFTDIGVHYRVAEQNAMAVIAERFGLAGDEPELVKQADLVLLATERRDLLPPTEHLWSTTADVKPLPMRIEPEIPVVARDRMLEEFDRIVLALTMVAHCRSCDAEIIWAHTPAGKRIPLDSVPVSGGTIALDRGSGIAKVITAEERRAFGGRPMFVSHFATCPNAASHRR